MNSLSKIVIEVVRVYDIGRCFILKDLLNMIISRRRITQIKEFRIKTWQFVI